MIGTENKYKNTDIGKLPLVWEVKSIGEYSTLISDYVANGSFASLKENVQYKDEKDFATLIRLVDYNNKFNGNFIYIDEKAYKFLKKTQLFGEEIIISNVGANVGTVFKCPKLNTNMSLAPNSIVIKTKGNDNFYFYWFKSPVGKHYLKSIVSGSAQPKFNKTDFKKIQIPIPPIETQEKIASILSALDDKIEINNEMNKTLEEMAQTLFKRWFIDFDFPNEKGEPYRCSGGKMVDSELGEIPEGWEVTKIENVVNIKRGASPRPIQDYISDNGIPWIKISDATSSISKFLNKTNEFIIEKGKEKSRFIERGTLILSNSATPGIPMIVNLDACVHDGWLIFNEYKNITKEFLYYVLKYHKENILALSNGSVFRNLKTDILKNYKIILPNLDLIILFNQSLEIIDKYIRNNVEEIQSLTEIRDALLPKLMSGEVEV